jgi:hypothetical protein
MIMSTTAMRGALKVALVLCVLAAFWNGGCSTTDPGTPRPGIAVAPSAITFNDTMGTAAPASQAIAISADGAGILTGLRAAVDFGGGSAGWLTVSLSDTTAPATLTLTSSPASLPAASYNATVVISATGAPNSPQHVPVAFHLAPPVPPSIALSPATVAFSDTMGAPATQPQAVVISRADTATAPLTALAVGNISYSGGSGSSGWLTATLSGTVAPATLTLTERKGSLAPGTYTASLPITSSVAANSPQNVVVTLRIAPRPPPPIPSGNTITIVATANLACGGDYAKESAKLVASANPDYVLVLGGNAIPADRRLTTLQDYQRCFEPLWGGFKSKTYATLGDHEVDIDSVSPYGSGMAPGADAYFGDRVGPPKENWYSFDVGTWHVIGLNVQTPGGYKRPESIAYHAGSPQLNWLIRDLRDHRKKCTLAFWYESMWISSTRFPANGSIKDGYRIQDVRGVWTALYEANADLVINGWPYIYERFAPMRYAEGYQHPTQSEYAADSARGIRQITTGLAGDGPIHADSAVIRHPLSEYRSGGNGVLKLVLGDTSYTWEFLNTKYSNIQDSGTGVCH